MMDHDRSHGHAHAQPEDVDKIIQEGDFLPSECKRLQDFAGEIWELKQALNQAQHQEKKCQDRIKAMKRQAEGANEINEKLQKDIKALLAKNLELEASCFGYREALQTSKESQSVWKARVTSLNNKIQKYESEINSLNVANRSLRESMYALTLFTLNCLDPSSYVCLREKMKQEMKDNKLKTKTKQLGSKNKDGLSLMEEVSLQDTLQRKVDEQERIIADLMRRNDILEAVIFTDHPATSPISKSSYYLNEDLPRDNE
jgi:chromosome segregation ATPase